MLLLLQCFFKKSDSLRTKSRRNRLFGGTLNPTVLNYAQAQKLLCALVYEQFQKLHYNDVLSNSQKGGKFSPGICTFT